MFKKGLTRPSKIRSRQAGYQELAGMLATCLHKQLLDTDAKMLQGWELSQNMLLSDFKELRFTVVQASEHSS